MLDRLSSMICCRGALRTAFFSVPRRRIRTLALLPVLLAAPAGGAMASGLGTTERVSVASDGSEGNDSSTDSSVSADGRYVAFLSRASNLVPSDTNGAFDIFVHDRQNGATERVSIASDGTEGNDRSGSPSISADGRYVAFDSDASNLVLEDTNGWRDIFLHDRETGTTERISVASDGTEGNESSFSPAISADGRFVAFSSGADNLVPGDTNGWSDIFVHDRESGQTVRVSVASDGTEGNASSGSPKISADGRFIAFSSGANNLVPDDTNGAFSDIFVHDRETGITERVSIASDGSEGNAPSHRPALSADGRYVAFQSFADNFVPDDTNGNQDIFVHDRETGVTERVSLASDGTEGNANANTSAISPDGRYVAFEGNADNHVPGDTNGVRDIFVHDRETGVTERASLASNGGEGNENSFSPAISANGHYIAFRGGSDNLVPGDTNESNDVFVRYRPELVIIPDPLDFGPVLVGEARDPLSVTITNPRLAQITVTEITAPQAPFASDGGTCGPLPFTLLQGESCELAYSFAPLSAETFETSVTLTSDAPDNPHTVTLRGLGVEEALTIVPDVLDFGGVLPGDTGGPAGVTLINTHGTAIEISDLTTPSAPFAASGGTCGSAPFSLAPFTSCTLDYTFSPAHSDVFSDVIELTSSAPSGPDGFTLQGEGLSRALSITPELLAFGNVPLGEVGGPLSVTLSSVGLLDVTLGDISDPGALFELTESTCGDVLPAGASCSLSYSFTPSEQTSSQTQVTIASDAQSNPHTVTLFGAGALHGTELISRASGVDGAKGGGQSLTPASSANGRVVAFVSYADLDPDDVNGNPDIYLRDLATNETSLMNRASGVDGEAGSAGASSPPSVSADGRFVAFQSSAPNIHPDDNDDVPDVFVRDRMTHETILVSRAAGADGVTANDDSAQPSLSANGRYVAFISLASNLHADDTDPGKWKVFVRDLQTDELILVSRAPGADGEKADNGSVSPSISADGRFVAFSSGAINLHPEDNDGIGDIIVRDLQTHENFLASRASGVDGVKVNQTASRPSISADGQRVAFETQANNLDPDDPPGQFSVSIYVRDLQTHETILVSRASGADGMNCGSSSPNPSISADGRLVAFDSQCWTLHPDDDDGGNLEDVFVRDLLTHETLLASRASGADGEASSRTSTNPSISANGRYVAFHSVATNLHPDDPDHTPDVYVRDLLGVAQLPQLTFNPPSLDFGDVTVGDTGPTLTATLANVAHGDADAVTLILEGLPASGFELDTNDCGFTLPVGASCEVGITFTPTALGAAAATLEATSLLQGVSATLSLNGAGMAPSPRIDTDPDSLSSILSPDQTETRPLTISNLGEATLDWEVSGGGALTGRILRPTGPVTSVTTRPAPKDVEGLAPVAPGTKTVASHPFPNAGAGDVTLTHSASPEIQSPNSTACNSGGTTAQNSFLRTFTLADFGITSGFDVSSVTFGVETLTTGMEVTVNLYTLEGEFVFDNLTLIGTATQELAPQSLTLLTVPVTGTAPAGSTLVVEILAPDLVGVGQFLPASNDLGETAPSYIAASACGADDPVTFSSIGFPNIHLVMAVMGAPFVPDCAMPGWLSVTPTSGSVAVGDSQLVDVTFDATSLVPGDHQANLCLASNDDISPLLPVPVTLTVTGPDGEEGYTPVALTVDPEGLISDGNGVFEPGERVDVAPWWRNDSGLAPVLMGTASGFAGPPDATYNLVADAADYGPIEPGQMASCLDTGICYTLELGEPAVRPAPHWEATFDETLDDSDETAKTWTLHIGGSFTDVPTASPFYSSIEALLHSGITGGCVDGAYCPGGVINRSQLPVFVLRALEGPEYTPSACAEDQEEFADVPFDSPFCPWIEELHHRNVVTGCGGGAYCPANPVTRAQMAIFLLKSLEGDGYTPIECTERFTDVPCSSLFADWIEDLAAREITGGCSATAYCPAAPVSRAQMAVFVTRAFGLTLYGP